MAGDPETLSSQWPRYQPLPPGVDNLRRNNWEPRSIAVDSYSDGDVENSLNTSHTQMCRRVAWSLEVGGCSPAFSCLQAEAHRSHSLSAAPAPTPL